MLIWMRCHLWFLSCIGSITSILWYLTIILVRYNGNASAWEFCTNSSTHRHAQQNIKGLSFFIQGIIYDDNPTHFFSLVFVKTQNAVVILWPGYVVRVGKHRGGGSARCCSCGIKGKQSLHIPWLRWSPHRGGILFSLSFNFCLLFGDKMGCGQGQQSMDPLLRSVLLLYGTQRKSVVLQTIWTFSVRRNTDYHKRHRLSQSDTDWQNPCEDYQLTTLVYFTHIEDTSGLEQIEFHENKLFGFQITLLKILLQISR